MSSPELPASHRSRRTAWMVGSAAVVLVAVVLLIVAFTTGWAKTGGTTERVGAGSATASAQAGPAASSATASSQAGPAASSAAAGTAAPSSPAAAAPAVPAPTAVAPGLETEAPPAPVLAVPMPPADESAAKITVQDFTTARAEALAETASPEPDTFKDLATGSAYDAMLATADEFANNGWHQVGVPAVASMTVTGYDPSATSPQATLNVCVDSAKVSVVTADGDVVKQGTAADRAMNILTVVQSGGKWLVSRESFPENPNC